MRRWIVKLGLVAAVGLGGATASAAVLKPLPLEQLATTADVVVLGRVIDTTARWQGGRIVTRVRLAPETVFKGEAEGPVEIEVLGGEVDGIAQRVSGASAFMPDERAVVFLRARGALHQVVGMTQGKLRVEVDPSGLAMVTDLKGVQFATPTPDGALKTVTPAPLRRVPLTRFAAALGRALAQP